MQRSQIVRYLSMQWAFQIFPKNPDGRILKPEFRVARNGKRNGCEFGKTRIWTKHRMKLFDGSRISNRASIYCFNETHFPGGQVWCLLFAFLKILFCTFVHE